MYYVYIITNFGKTVLYTGVTNNLAKRIWQHKNKVVKGFSSKYYVDRLVYFEVTNSIESAIMREKQIKAGTRKRKIDLINKMNPDWSDMYEQIVK